MLTEEQIQKRAKYSTHYKPRFLGEAAENDFDIVATVMPYFEMNQCGHSPFNDFLIKMVCDERCRDYTLKISADDRWQKGYTLYYLSFMPRIDGHEHIFRFNGEYDEIGFKTNPNRRATYRYCRVGQFIEDILKDYEEQTFMCFVGRRNHTNSEVEIGLVKE